MQIETILELVKSNRVIWTDHASDRVEQRKIRKEEVLKGILNGEIIEDYPNETKFQTEFKIRRKNNEVFLL